MELIRIGVLAIISAILILVIKTYRPEMSISISLVFGAIVMFFLAMRIRTVLDPIHLYLDRWVWVKFISHAFQDNRHGLYYRVCCRKL